MTNERVIKMLEYMKANAGLSEQGDKWSPNAETIALDEAIKAMKIVSKIPEVIQEMEDCRNSWTASERNNRISCAKVESWNSAINLVSELIKMEEN